MLEYIKNFSSITIYQDFVTYFFGYMALAFRAVISNSKSFWLF